MKEMKEDDERYVVDGCFSSVSRQGIGNRETSTCRKEKYHPVNILKQVPSQQPQLGKQ